MFTDEVFKIVIYVYRRSVQNIDIRLQMKCSKYCRISSDKYVVTTFVCLLFTVEMLVPLYIAPYYSFSVKVLFI